MELLELKKDENNGENVKKINPLEIEKKTEKNSTLEIIREDVTTGNNPSYQNKKKNSQDISEDSSPKSDNEKKQVVEQTSLCKQELSNTEGSTKGESKSPGIEKEDKSPSKSEKDIDPDCKANMENNDEKENMVKKSSLGKDTQADIGYSQQIR